MLNRKTAFCITQSVTEIKCSSNTYPGLSQIDSFTFSPRQLRLTSISAVVGEKMRYTIIYLALTTVAIHSMCGFYGIS